MQNPSDGSTNKNTKDVNGYVGISGGTVGVLSLEPSAKFGAAVTGGHVGEVSYFQEAEGRDLKEFVTGGTFGTEIPENFLAWGYQLTGDAAPYTVQETGRREVVTIEDGNVTEFANEKDITVGTLTYKRSFAAVNTWQALYLPFEIPVATLINLGYDVAYTNDVHLDDNEFDGVIDRIWVEYIGIKSGTLRANFPYVIRANRSDALDLTLVLNEAKLRNTSDDNQTVLECSSAFYQFEFGGTYSIINRNDVRESEETSCFALVASNGNWAEFINDDLTLNPFRIYMTMTAKDGSVVISEEALRSIGSRLVGEEIDGTTIIYDVYAEDSEDIIYDLSGRRVLKAEKGGIYIINGKKVLVK